MTFEYVYNTDGYQAEVVLEVASNDYDDFRAISCKSYYDNVLDQDVEVTPLVQREVLTQFNSQVEEDPALALEVAEKVQDSCVH